MATELPPVTVATPTPETTITPVVVRRIWGRLYDGALISVAFVAALLVSLDGFSFTSLGLTQTQAAWAGLAVFVIRFALAYQPIKRVDLLPEPPAGGGHG